VTTLTTALHQAWDSTAAGSGSVVVVRDLRGLTGFIPDWEELAAQALEPNVFYEHWMLLPALAAFGAGLDVGVALVLAGGDLAGLFPVQFTPSFRNLNVSAVSVWRHLHCYLGTPLIRADRAGDCITALLEWLRRSRQARFLELPWIPGDGRFRELLLERCNELGLTTWRTDSHERGLWRQAPHATGGAHAAVSGELRRQLRRKERRLAEHGRVEHVVLSPGDDVARWIEEFLRLEAGGWKGASGTALACSDSGRRYFVDIATAAFRRGRLLMVGLDFDGEPIARRCAFRAGEGSFAFKTAHDECFASHSPGAILEMDNLTQLDGLEGLRWMDSCTTPDNTLLNRICNDSRTIESLAIASGPLGELVISGLRLLRWTNRRLIKRVSDPTSTDVAS